MARPGHPPKSPFLSPVAHLLAVLRVGEVDEVVVVHLLGVDDVTVLLLAQVLGVDAVGPQELLVGHAEGLADGLGDELGLQERGGDGRGSATGDRQAHRPGQGGGPWLGSKELQRNVAQVSVGGALLMLGTLPAPTQAALNLRHPKTKPMSNKV